MSATTISADHLDLLVTAAVRYGVLSNTTRGAFTAAHPRAEAVVASPTAAGQLLLDQALTTPHAPHRCPPPVAVLDPDLRTYRHVAVPHIDALEVLKAAHTYQDWAASSPGWTYSSARHLLVDLIRAAIERLPGYAAAPHAWRRPPLRTGPPVGLRRRWIPVDEHVRWLTPEELTSAWDTAALVVITVEALADLPSGLSRRDGVYVIAGAALTTTEWGAIAQSPSLLLVQLPAGAEWLRAELESVAAGGQPTRPQLAPVGSHTGALAEEGSL